MLQKNFFLITHIIDHLKGSSLNTNENQLNTSIIFKKNIYHLNKNEIFILQNQSISVSAILWLLRKKERNI